ncbi:MAG: Ig-like domain-containing protein [Pseudobdellovibrionaceae bacterium]|nr:hypothetical protein [Bdellovibrionales bacterium]USN48157.1 MAG: Ig-like domain-containing protein [Pseudobdellovibrionaceae bacterium]
MTWHRGFVRLLLVSVWGVSTLGCTNANPIFENFFGSKGDSGSENKIKIISIAGADDGVYRVADRVTIEVVFDGEVVLQDGSALLPLDTSPVLRWARCVQTSFNQLSCQYLVGQGDQASDLDVLSGGLLKLSDGASLRGAHGESLDLALIEPGKPDSLSFHSDIQVYGGGLCLEHADSALWARFDQNGDGSILAPYLICTAAQLQNIYVGCGEFNNVSCGKHFILGADIDLHLSTFNRVSEISSYPFQGSIVGNDHRIKNLQIRGGMGVGLMKHVGSSGRIEHLQIENIFVSSNYATSHSVGALVGKNEGQIDGVRIVHSRIDRDVATTFYGVGGMVGYNVASGAVTNSHVVGNSQVSGGTVGDQMGGLVGLNEGRIETSSSTASVLGRHELGGLVGLHQWEDAEIHSSFALGDVSGATSRLGGFVGHAYQSSGSGKFISDSFATGSVQTASGDSVGGFVGLSYQSDFYRVLATGNVTGDQYVGGLVGGLSNGTGLNEVQYTNGVVDGNGPVGGLVGVFSTNGSELNDCIFSGAVDGNFRVGGLLGESSNLGNVSHCLVLGENLSIGSQKGTLAGYSAFESNYEYVLWNSNLIPLSPFGFLVSQDGFNLSNSARTDAELKQAASYADFDLNIWKLPGPNTVNHATLKNIPKPESVLGASLIAYPDSVVVMANSSRSFLPAVFTFNDWDLEGNAITLSAVTPFTSAGGTLTWDPLFGVIYEPPQGFHGHDMASYEITDVNGNKAFGVIEIEVVQFFDYFNRGSISNAEHPWSTYITSGHTVGVMDGSMKLIASDGSYSPQVTRPVNKITGGKYLLQFSVNLKRTFTEGAYALFVQLGQEDQMEIGANLNSINRLNGVAVSSKWAGTDSSHDLGGMDADQKWGVETGRNSTLPVAVATGSHTVQIFIDMDAKQYEFKALGHSSGPQSFADANISEIDSIRVFMNGFNSANFDPVLFEQVEIKKLP